MYEYNISKKTIFVQVNYTILCLPCNTFLFTISKLGKLIAMSKLEKLCLIFIYLSRLESTNFSYHRCNFATHQTALGKFLECAHKL